MESIATLSLKQDPACRIRLKDIQSHPFLRSAAVGGDDLRQQSPEFATCVVSVPDRHTDVSSLPSTAPNQELSHKPGAIVVDTIHTSSADEKIGRESMHCDAFSTSGMHGNEPNNIAGSYSDQSKSMFLDVADDDAAEEWGHGMVLPCGFEKRIKVPVPASALSSRATLPSCPLCTERLKPQTHQTSYGWIGILADGQVCIAHEDDTEKDSSENNGAEAERQVCGMGKTRKELGAFSCGAIERQWMGGAREEGDGDNRRGKRDGGAARSRTIHTLFFVSRDGLEVRMEQAGRPSCSYRFPSLPGSLVPYYAHAAAFITLVASYTPKVVYLSGKAQATRMENGDLDVRFTDSGPVSFIHVDSASGSVALVTRSASSVTLPSLYCRQPDIAGGIVGLLNRRSSKASSTIRMETIAGGKQDDAETYKKLDSGMGNRCTKQDTAQEEEKRFWDAVSFARRCHRKCAEAEARALLMNASRKFPIILRSHQLQSKEWKVPSPQGVSVSSTHCSGGTSSSSASVHRCSREASTTSVSSGFSSSSTSATEEALLASGSPWASPCKGPTTCLSPSQMFNPCTSLQQGHRIDNISNAITEEGGMQYRQCSEGAVCTTPLSPCTPLSPTPSSQSSLSDKTLLSCTSWVRNPVIQSLSLSSSPTASVCTSWASSGSITSEHVHTHASLNHRDGFIADRTPRIKQANGTTEQGAVVGDSGTQSLKFNDKLVGGEQWVYTGHEKSVVCKNDENSQLQTGGSISQRKRGEHTEGLGTSNKVSEDGENASRACREQALADAGCFDQGNMVSRWDKTVQNGRNADMQEEGRGSTIHASVESVPRFAEGRTMSLHRTSCNARCEDSEDRQGMTCHKRTLLQGKHGNMGRTKGSRKQSDKLSSPEISEASLHQSQSALLKSGDRVVEGAPCSVAKGEIPDADSGFACARREVKSGMREECLSIRCPHGLMPQFPHGNGPIGGGEPSTCGQAASSNSQHSVAPSVHIAAHMGCSVSRSVDDVEIVGNPNKEFQHSQCKSSSTEGRVICKARMTKHEKSVIRSRPDHASSPVFTLGLETLASTERNAARCKCRGRSFLLRKSCRTRDTWMNAQVLGDSHTQAPGNCPCPTFCDQTVGRRQPQHDIKFNSRSWQVSEKKGFQDDNVASPGENTPGAGDEHRQRLLPSCSSRMPLFSQGRQRFQSPQASIVHGIATHLSCPLRAREVDPELDTTERYSRAAGASTGNVLFDQSHLLGHNFTLPIKARARPDNGDLAKSGLACRICAGGQGCGKLCAGHRDQVVHSDIVPEGGDGSEHEYQRSRGELKPQGAVDWLRDEIVYSEDDVRKEGKQEYRDPKGEAEPWGDLDWSREAIVHSGGDPEESDDLKQEYQVAQGKAHLRGVVDGLRDEIAHFDDIPGEGNDLKHEYEVREEDPNPQSVTEWFLKVEDRVKRLLSMEESKGSRASMNDCVPLPEGIQVMSDKGEEGLSSFSVLVKPKPSEAFPAREDNAAGSYVYEAGSLVNSLDRGIECQSTYLQGVGWGMRLPSGEIFMQYLDGCQVRFFSHGHFHLAEISFCFCQNHEYGKRLKNHLQGVRPLVAELYMHVNL
ncbi:hypothetical protein CBR_g36850 [Chara braunii]|uniref:Cryptic POLO box 1 (CPB1) domain-containing protein n=1 Tax=Chara braunii TaxID=69332 RepID=A0A388LLY2_CHABU|nr:hypothetical protein CBR_g36850 [Chara braunii]|eukprot:GBG83235.1 hypothetical protein CBR_g36850 [Chara braunii]